MLWFNAEKDLGALRTEEGERLEVPGTAFAPGEKPAERCAGRPVEYQSLGETVYAVEFLPEPNPRRARSRQRR